MLFVCLLWPCVSDLELFKEGGYCVNLLVVLWRFIVMKVSEWGLF